jgi:thiol-disulfide isomerase/thioredoxin
MKRRGPIIAVIIAVLFMFLGTSALAAEISSGEDIQTLYVFYSRTCPHCKEELAFLEEIKDDYPGLEIRTFDVYEKENSQLFRDLAKAYNMPEPLGVPVTFIGDYYEMGFGSADTTGKEIEAEIQRCLEEGCPDSFDRLDNGRENQTETNESLGIIQLPWGFEIDTSEVGLPLFTVVLAGLDGVNPCAIWVLCFLLTLMIYAKSRKKMMLIGSIFVLTSGIIYFVFMAAWLNFFLVIGYVNILRIIVALVAIIVGLTNMKDFFYFKKGISFTIPDSWKPKLTKRMRGLVHESALPAAALGTVVLALMANTFELVCTFGLPAIYTRALTLQNLPTATYYSYLLLYNIIYVIPLAIVVGIFVLTMGAHRFTEKQGRILKLVAGALMLLLGLILLLRPGLLSF